MRVFCDFHHSSLLRSFFLTFEKRLGMEVFRPIGMEWFHEGWWAINDQEDTARQFLDLDQALKPGDGTPPLNKLAKTTRRGEYYALNPGGRSVNRACTLEFFKEHEFDFVIASIPAHVPVFERLIAEYQPKAKLIVQMGNNWDLNNYAGYNVLASIAPQLAPGVNVHFYHQEFDLVTFGSRPTEPTRNIYSYINILQNTGIGWTDFKELERRLSPDGFEFKSYGGQCRDGNMDGEFKLSRSMQDAQFIFHVKPGGDGFGHIIHNAYAIGRPVITRPSHYKGQLAERLLSDPNTIVDLDKLGREKAAKRIFELTQDPDELWRMGRTAAERFREVVNYEKEAEEISQWLDTL